MKATIDQAETNERRLSLVKTGYGHWKISMRYKNKEIGCTTTNSMAVDDFKSELGEVDSFGANRIKKGYIALCEEIIRKNEGSY